MKIPGRITGGGLFFLLGTKRARDLWAVGNPNINQEFVKMVKQMIPEVQEIDFWDRLDTIS